MDQTSWETHLRLCKKVVCGKPLLVELKEPEDGITPEIDSLLVVRKGDTKIDSWDALWRLLFPDDDKIPSSRRRFCFPISQLLNDSTS